MTKKSIFSRFFLPLITLLLPFMALSNTYEVNSLSTFNSAQSNASSGDTIVWKQGLYHDIDIFVYKWGIVMMAEVAGKTVFTGASKLKLTGSNNTISGFQYLGGNIGNGFVIDIEGSNNHLTQINIKDYYCYKYLLIRAIAEFNTISYCNFENRTFIGDQNILSVLVAPHKPGYHTIRHCSFKNFEGTTPGGDAGVEPIRIGVSSQAEYVSRTTVEYCYFTQCNGDGEIISHKSKQNVYRYNTFEDNPYGEFVLRHGDAGIVYGNFFLDGFGGIRIKEGQDHVVFNNYFSGLSERSIILQNHSADPLQRIFIAFNTIVNSEEIRLGGSGPYQPTDVTFANNIFNNPTGVIMNDPTGTENWIGNLYNGQLGIPASEGFVESDPQLQLNSEGFYQPGSGSPAINSAQAGYPAISEISGLDIDHDIMLDIMKQMRPADISQKDIGCNEFSEQMVVQPHATEYNTGPTYLQDQNYVLLQITVDGEGTVSADPPSWVYDAGEEVTLTAVPGPFEVFKEWGGDISGTTNPVTITMDQDKEVQAVFEALPTYNIQIYKEGEGDVTVDPPGWTYLDSTQITLTAVPDSGYVFDQWTGNVFSTDNPLVVTVTSDLILFANFKSLPLHTEGSSDPERHDPTFPVKIFPNPVHGSLQFVLSDKYSGRGDVKIYDANGECVLTVPIDKLIKNQENNFVLDVSTLPPGIFTVQFLLQSGNNKQKQFYNSKFLKI